jgi:hypothetical protein
MSRCQHETKVKLGLWTLIIVRTMIVNERNLFFSVGLWWGPWAPPFFRPGPLPTLPPRFSSFPPPPIRFSFPPPCRNSPVPGNRFPSVSSPQVPFASLEEMPIIQRRKQGIGSRSPTPPSPLSKGGGPASSPWGAQLPWFHEPGPALSLQPFLSSSKGI